jgi:hypothetical protein
MRGLSILILLVLILPTLQLGPSSPMDGNVVTATDRSMNTIEGSIKLVISEVCPGKPVEYVVLTNLGSSVLLNGTTVTDGEGSITVRDDIVLGTRRSIAFALNTSIFFSIHPDIACLEKGNASLNWGGRFTLADTGDSVALMVEGHVIDIVIYGSAQYSGDGWTGPAVGSVPKTHALVRVYGDSNTASDWSVEPPGRSDFGSANWDVIVEPFSAPENAAERLVRELNMATRTVNCSVYEITDPAVVAAMARCSRRGIDVNVLVEGQPVGGLSNASLRAISTLQASKADVRATHSVDSYKRYDYLHAKYMVVDGRRVVVMSENWGSGLYGNRGWGVCMDGLAVGKYYDTVFAADFLGRMDIIVPETTLPTLDDAPNLGTSIDDLLRSRCHIFPLLSPDNSEVAIHNLLANAQGKILIEQLSVDKDWLSEPSLLSDLVSAASRGVQVRLLLDCSWGGGDNPEVVESLNMLSQSNGLDLEAKLISEYHELSMMHNKGIIVDDQVVISSINWGNSALRENREAGVIISSTEITSFFEDLFWKDWALDPIPPSADLPWTYLSMGEGEVAFLDGRLSSDNSGKIDFEWDMDGDGSVDNRSSTWSSRLAPGNHSIILTVRDLGNNTATAVCWIEVMARGNASSDTPSVLLLFPILVVGAMYTLKRIIGRKRH